MLSVALTAMALVAIPIIPRPDTGTAVPLWGSVAIAVLLGATLIGRRRWPMIACLSFTAIALGSTLAGERLFTTTLPFLSLFLVIAYSAVSWARGPRRRIGAMAIGCCAMMVAVVYLIGTSDLDAGVAARLSDPDAGEANLSKAALLAAVTTVFYNQLFIAAPMAMGQLVWRLARDRVRLQDQADVIAAQTEELNDRAVTEERLRISRELHDMAAHHIAAIAVQAGAARMLVVKDPSSARTILDDISDSARNAVAALDTLLHGLRRLNSAGRAHTGAHTVSAETMTMADAVDLAERDALSIDLSEPAGWEALVPAEIYSVAVKIVHAALTNVMRHSAADVAEIIVTVDSAGQDLAVVQIDVTDPGPAIGGTGGSGLGVLGMQERAARVGGSCTAGGTTNGFRVKTRLPFTPVRPSPGAAEGSM